MEIKLINIEDIKKIRSISDVINYIKEIDPYIYQTQSTVIKEILGEELYFDIILEYKKNAKNNLHPIPQKYINLLDGVEYEHNNKMYIFNGLKQVIAYYVYYDFLKSWGMHITNAGIVVKTGDMSLPVTDADRGRMLAATKQTLIIYVNDLKKFLTRHKNEYDLYFCGRNSEYETGSVTFLTAQSREGETWH